MIRHTCTCSSRVRDASSIHKLQLYSNFRQKGGWVVSFVIDVHPEPHTGRVAGPFKPAYLFALDCQYQIKRPPTLLRTKNKIYSDEPLHSKHENIYMPAYLFCLIVKECALIKNK